MRIVGLSAYYHDSAVALVEDGAVHYAAEEERFSRIKHDNGFPLLTYNNMLATTGISSNDIDCIAYYEKPLRKFERILENFVDTYPRSQRAFLRGMPEWLGGKLAVEHTIRSRFGFTKDILFIPHHYSHAAAAFFSSPFEHAAILTADGIGEYQTTALWSGNGAILTPLKELHFPDSLGLFYAACTAFLGFKVNEDEYKLMGLAALGEPRYVEEIKKMIRISSDGSFALEPHYFAFRHSERMWSHDMETLLGAARSPSAPLEERHADVAASVQSVTEELYLAMLRHLHEITRADALCIGGGVALNALANGKVLAKTSFKRLHIFGPSGDSGAALGAALYAATLRSVPRVPVESLMLGSSYADAAIEEALVSAQQQYQRFDSKRTLCERVAALLAGGAIVGWFQGRMEFGPRALGARSILADPREAKMKDAVNRIKGREKFRPFGASVLESALRTYADVAGDTNAYPHMNICFQVRPERGAEIAAVVHSDGSCRMQTVNESAGVYYELIAAFDRITGVPVLLNTSFNRAGEPIVETPRCAIEDFLETPMDALAIGNFLVTKPGTARDALL